MKKLFYIALVFLLVACTKKGGNIYLKGRVWDPVLNKGKSGVDILLMKEQPLKGDLFNGGSSKEVKRVTTNNEGYFEVLHLGSLANKYYLLMENVPNNHHQIGWTNKSLLTNIQKGKEVNSDFYLLEHQVSQLKLSNVNCEGSSDSLIISLKYLEPYYNFNINTTKLGCVDEESFSSQRFPGKWLYEWEVTRPSGTSQGELMVNITPNSSNEVVIEY